MNIEKRISHEASMYLRCKDMFDTIPQDKIEYLQSVVRKNYMSLDINIEFASAELNDFDEAYEIYIDFRDDHVVIDGHISFKKLQPLIDLLIDIKAEVGK